MTSTRLVPLAGCALALVTTLAGPAAAQTGGGANNLVQVVSASDATFAARGRVQAVAYGGPSAQSTNLARADSRACTGCRTQAAALQALFLTGDPSTVEVANAAVATNSACTSCTAYAYAYQYVVTSERAVSLSPAGRQRLQDLQARVDEAVAEPASTLEGFVALDARLDALAAELRTVIDDELRAGGHEATTRGHRERLAV